MIPWALQGSFPVTYFAYLPILQFFFLLIWILVCYSNPSVFCMNNIFFLLVIILFWNKYITIRWVQKAIFVTLGSILHTVYLLLLFSKQISPFFSLWYLFFCLLLTTISMLLVYPIFLHGYHSYICFCFSRNSLYIQPCISAKNVLFPSGRKFLCWLCSYQVSPSLPHPSWYLQCQLCVTASLGIPVRRSGVGRGDEQYLPLAALSTNSDRKPSQRDMNVFLTQIQN